MKKRLMVLVTVLLLMLTCIPINASGIVNDLPVYIKIDLAEEDVHFISLPEEIEFKLPAASNGKMSDTIEGQRNLVLKDYSKNSNWCLSAYTENIPKIMKLKWEQEVSELVEEDSIQTDRIVSEENVTLTDAQTQIASVRDDVMFLHGEFKFTMSKITLESEPYLTKPKIEDAKIIWVLDEKVRVGGER
ncbi:MAG TPA: hypothetical protein VIG45_01135 [Erysipelothrix sp.]